MFLSSLFVGRLWCGWACLAGGLPHHLLDDAFYDHRPQAPQRSGLALLRLVALPDLCSDCQTYTRICPMSLDVKGMVKSAQMEDSECILCGNRIDDCSKGAIHFSFSAGR